MLIKSGESCLVLLDTAEGPAPAGASENVKLLLNAARELDVPVLLIARHPPALGPLVEKIAAASNGFPSLRTLPPSSVDDGALCAAFTALGRRQAVIAGVAAEGGVAPVAADLGEAGFAVFLVADAAQSAGRQSGGATIATTEMVVFEWLGRAGTESFRKLLPLIK